MKTIKQIADEIGVSKQAVQKRISREPLHSRVYASIDRIDGVLYIASTGEMLIKQAFLGDDCIQVADNQPTKQTSPSIPLYTPVYTPSEDILAILKDTVATLQEQLSFSQGQLAIKDAQIVELTDELRKEREHSHAQGDKLFLLADQAQHLHAKSFQQLPLEAEKPRFFKRLFGKQGSD